MAASKGSSKALDLLRRLPRVSLSNLKPHPDAVKRTKRGRGMHGGGTHGAGRGRNKPEAHQNFFRVGFEPDQYPFYLRFPEERFYRGHHLKLSYIPLSLHKLQLMIDTNRVRTNVQIDVSQLMASGLYRLRPIQKEGGFMLTDEGLDCFEAVINLEVQWANEHIIAAVERAGGTITTAFYDPMSLMAVADPLAYFKTGKPIPRRMLPPQNLIEYYSEAKNRGYLADPDCIAEERLLLAQKYGYTLPDLSTSPMKKTLLERKDPRQPFHGLEPGWVVNMTDKVILKPLSPVMKEYYAS